MSNHMKQNLVWSSALTVGCGLVLYLMFAIYGRAPQHRFRPFCITDLAYRLNVTIEFTGMQYSSVVVSQRSHSLGWLALIHGGCEQTHGTALSFRLADNRLVLIGSFICSKATRAFADAQEDYYSNNFSHAMREHRKADLTSLCVGVSRDRPASYSSSYDGFIIDNADNPRRWRGFNFESADMKEYIRIDSAVAEAMDISPEDQLDKDAPEILKTTFTYDNWSASPEGLLPFFRRYLPTKQFVYTAQEERLQVVRPTAPMPAVNTP
jgi:hypothetical protein